MYNEIGDEGLQILAKTVFKDNKQINSVILNNNLIGSSPNAKQSMTVFLESYLLELEKPQFNLIPAIFINLTDELEARVS